MDCLCIAAEADPIGYVLVNGRPLTTTDLARLTGEPEAAVQSALAELERNGVFSRDRSGRIYNRRMVRDAKERSKNQKNGRLGGNPTLCNTTEKSLVVNPPDNQPDKAKRLEARSYKPERKHDPPTPRKRGAVDDPKFEEFWRAYPRRVDKGHARKAWPAALRSATTDEIIAGAKRYAEKREGGDEKFTMHPGAWLNGERWTDEARPNGKRPYDTGI